MARRDSSPWEFLFELLFELAGELFLEPWFWGVLFVIIVVWLLGVGVAALIRVIRRKQAMRGGASPLP